jgi:hypothetical protein
MENNACRLCGSHPLVNLLELKNVPRDVQSLNKNQVTREGWAINLNILCCSACNLVQINPILSDDYYEDYLMGTTHSNQMLQYQLIQANEFIAKYNLVGKHIKEIGCGDGTFLKFLQGGGAIVSGIEPSKPFRERALQKGLKVYSVDVRRGAFFEDSPWDAFVMRQVLEHVSDINGFLIGLRDNLVAGAIGLIEVPSFEKAVTDGRFYDFFPDHVNYFSLKTLSLAFELNGFDILDGYSGMGGEYNIIIVKKRLPTSLSAMQLTMLNLTSDLSEIVGRSHALGKKIAIWGAGGKGVSLLHSANLKDIDLLVDSDANKQGMYIPGLDLKVFHPEELVKQRMDIVVITAMAYWNEIGDELRNKYSFNGEIFILGQKLIPLDGESVVD